MISVMGGNELSEPPIEIIEYMLCEKFGWTITQLYEQPAEKVTRFLQIMSIKRQHENIQQQAAAAGN